MTDQPISQKCSQRSSTEGKKNDIIGETAGHSEKPWLHHTSQTSDITIDQWRLIYYKELGITIKQNWNQEISIIDQLNGFIFDRHKILFSPDKLKEQENMRSLKIIIFSDTL